jgi:hypothetical protein
MNSQSYANLGQLIRGSFYKNEACKYINKDVNGVYIVPQYPPKPYATYDALTHGDLPTYSGYFDVEKAYGKESANFQTRYVTKQVCQTKLK